MRGEPVQCSYRRKPSLAQISHPTSSFAEYWSFATHPGKSQTLILLQEEKMASQIQFCILAGFLHRPALRRGP